MIVGRLCQAPLLPFQTPSLRTHPLPLEAPPLELLKTAYRLFYTHPSVNPQAVSSAFLRVTPELLHSVLFIKSGFID